MKVRKSIGNGLLFLGILGMVCTGCGSSVEEAKEKAEDNRESAYVTEASEASEEITEASEESSEAEAKAKVEKDPFLCDLIYYARVDTDIYADKSVKSEVIAQVSKGQIVKIAEYKMDWIPCELEDGTKGYIRGNLVSTTQLEATQVAEETGGGSASQWQNDSKFATYELKEVNTTYSGYYLSDDRLPTLDGIIASLPGGSTEERIYAVNTWMCDNLTYDYSYSYYYANQALDYRTCVCQGYAQLFHDFMLRMGIPCDYVNGMADNGVSVGSHGWDAVQVDGLWYYIDVTWNDGCGNRMKYYMLSYEDMAVDHNCRQGKYEPGGSSATYHDVREGARQQEVAAEQERQQAEWEAEQAVLNQQTAEAYLEGEKERYLCSGESYDVTTYEEYMTIYEQKRADLNNEEQVRICYIGPVWTEDQQSSLFSYRNTFSAYGTMGQTGDTMTICMVFTKRDTPENRVLDQINEEVQVQEMESTEYVFDQEMENTEYVFAE